METPTYFSIIMVDGDQDCVTSVNVNIMNKVKFTDVFVFTGSRLRRSRKWPNETKIND